MAKYELTDETKEIDGRTLYRIRALCDFNDVKAGDLGGFVENEDNLSHEGNCWVYDDACVYYHALVSENAKLQNSASSCGHAVVCNNAVLKDNASANCDAWITDNATVGGSAIVKSASEIGDNAVVGGDAIISNDAVICGNAVVCSNAGYIVVKGLGSEYRTTTAFRAADGLVYIKCGCYLGTFPEFCERVGEVHGNNEFALEYLNFANMVSSHFRRGDANG